MARYLALPNELKDLINLSQQDISRLSRTSRTMRKALVPKLFKRVSMSWEALKPPPCISSLLLAILQSPDLAKMVEEICFHGNNYRKSLARNPEWRRHINENVLRYLSEDRPKADGAITVCKPILKEAMHSMKLSGNEWKLVLGGEHELDFVIATILTNCPNLKVLRLGADFLHKNTVLSKLLGHVLGLKAGGSTAALRKLERVYLAHDIPCCRDRHGMMEFPLSSFLPIFLLPSLETLSTPFPPDHTTTLSRRALLPEWPITIPSSSTIRTLDLHNTRAKPTTVAFILLRTLRLKHLNYNHLCHTDDLLFNCTELRNALETVNHTLEELTISIKPFTDQAEDIDETRCWTENDRGLYSLASMSHLTKLEISLPILLGWEEDTGLGLEDVLPSSLEDFCIRDDFVGYYDMVWNEEKTVDKIRHWLGNKAWKKSTPNMKRVGLRLWNSKGEEWSLKWREIVMNICATEGLDCWYERQHGEQEMDMSTGRCEEVDYPRFYSSSTRNTKQLDA